MEQELVLTKQKLGEAMNVVMEHGGTDMIEKIYEAINMGENEAI